MAWTNPTTRTTGELITSAIWNTDLKDKLLLLKTNIANDGRWTGELKTFSEAVTQIAVAGGVLGLDLSVSNNFRVSLTENVTTILIVNWPASKATAVSLRLSQDSVGGRTVVFPGAWHWAGGAAPVMTPAADKTDIFMLWSDDGGAAIWPTVYTQNA